jgi:hypothetical protein
MWEQTGALLPSVPTFPKSRTQNLSKHLRFDRQLYQFLILD